MIFMILETSVDSSSAELFEILTRHALNPSINLLFDHMDGFTFCLIYFGSNLN